MCLEKMRERMADNNNEKIKGEILQASLDNYNDKVVSEETLNKIKEFVKNNDNDVTDEAKAEYR